MASRKLNDLSERFRPLAVELLARCVEAGLAVLIVETRRTIAEHRANVARGVSWTNHSKHIDGDAIDLAPYDIYELHGADKLQWNSGDPAWQRMGVIGETLGLVWGGRWTHRDMGHFEYPGSPPNFSAPPRRA